jgi:hypothetical protein
MREEDIDYKKLKMEFNLQQCIKESVERGLKERSSLTDHKLTMLNLSA